VTNRKLRAKTSAQSVCTLAISHARSISGSGSGSVGASGGAIIQCNEPRSPTRMIISDFYVCTVQLYTLHNPARLVPGPFCSRRASISPN
jgi:hypothetical protein